MLLGEHDNIGIFLDTYVQRGKIIQKKFNFLNFVLWLDGEYEYETYPD